MSAVTAWATNDIPGRRTPGGIDMQVVTEVLGVGGIVPRRE